MKDLSGGVWRNIPGEYWEGVDSPTTGDMWGLD